MKKKYIRPNTKYVPIEMSEMLASSTTSDSIVSIPVDNTNTYSGSFHSKKEQVIFWDDEDGQDGE
jgi:hypothetical protein